MAKTYSAGGVVINKEGKVLIVNQRGKSWSLPKGHIKKNENKLHTAKREIHEETGINKLEFIKELGSYERKALKSELKDDPNEIKHMTFFLFKTSQEKLHSHDIDNPKALWIEKNKVVKILTHPKDKAFFNKIKSKIKV